jgi:ammonium transporter, Amt family
VMWMLLDILRSRRATAVGAATGIVVGLVAITPAAGFVGPLGAMALGAVAAVPSYFAILYRSRSRMDDSLDVFAAHGTGGLVGALLTGVFASAVWGGENGLLYGEPGLVLTQGIGALGTILYSGIMTFLLLKMIALFVTLRRKDGEEGVGMDIIQHGEEGYTRGEGAVLVLSDSIASVPKPPVREVSRPRAGATV